MRKRPLSVTIVAWLYIATGAVGLAFHLAEFNPRGPFEYELIWVALVRLAAVLCGIYMLRGRDWARWLALAWIAFHVILGALQSWQQFIMHGLLCAIFGYVLLRRPARRFFRPAPKHSS